MKRRVYLVAALAMLMSLLVIPGIAHAGDTYGKHDCPNQADFEWCISADSTALGFPGYSCGPTQQVVRGKLQARLFGDGVITKNVNNRYLKLESNVGVLAQHSSSSTKAITKDWTLLSHVYFQPGVEVTSFYGRFQFTQGGTVWSSIDNVRIRVRLSCQPAPV